MYFTHKPKGYPVKLNQWWTISKKEILELQKSEINKVINILKEKSKELENLLNN